ncbi:MAG: DUF4147 domain-containing protein [Planctomycetota bacterium]
MEALSTKDIRPIADAVIGAVLKAADPADAVRRAWPEELDRASRVVLIAAGKASAGMTEAAVQRLGSRVTRGAVACVPDHERRVLDAVTNAGCGPVEVRPADHPLPTGRNLRAAKAIADAAGLCNEQDTVLALISGGASAHLCMPADGVTLDELRDVSEALLRAGATIEQLNAVRKHAEKLKGGGLARLAWPAAVEVLVLSDVLGDPLDTIGSGPTAGDPSTFAQALAVLDEHDLRRVSPSVTAHLVRGSRGEEAETPQPDDELLVRTRHRVVANNALAVEAATRALLDLGFRVEAVRRDVQGDAADVGLQLGERVREMAQDGKTERRAVVIGGETTVRVGDATGKGGRNQEMALAAATQISGLQRAAVVTFATDGVDGPTDAAGAIATGRTAREASRAGGNLSVALAEHDSYTIFGSIDALIRTGPTGTNVNDVAVGLTL